jgi:hypothetical protein
MANGLSMKMFFSLIGRLIGLFLLFFSIAGCTNSASNPENKSLIRVRDRVLTVLEFNQAFEISKTAYPYNLRNEPDELRNAQRRLLNELMIEMILLERAEELGLSVSDEELAKAVADIKGDYPEDTFEKTLLEFAVPYEIWEARLRKRLLMEKVVGSELKDQIVITPEDIAKYYEQHFKALEPNMDSTIQMENINELIIKNLRREKTEQAYKKLINKLKQQYDIEINRVQWEKISGTHFSEGEDFGAFHSTKE